MAQLEIRDAENTRTIVELGPEPLLLGLDAHGRAAWGPGRVARMLAEVEGDLLRVGGKERLLRNPTITRAVLDSGAAIPTSEAAVQDTGRDELTIDVRAILCAPLHHEGRAQGVLYTDNEERGGSFTNDELDFASALAHLASFALENLTATEALRGANLDLLPLPGEALGLAADAVPK